jgi:hypothetical protein
LYTKSYDFGARVKVRSSDAIEPARLMVEDVQ